MGLLNKSIWLGVKIYENDLPNFKTINNALTDKEKNNLLSLDFIKKDVYLYNKLKNFDQELFGWAGLQDCFKRLQTLQTIEDDFDVKLIIIDKAINKYWFFDVVAICKDISKEFSTMVDWKGSFWENIVFLSNKYQGDLNDEVITKIKFYSEIDSTKNNPAFYIKGSKAKELLDLLKLNI